MKEELKRNKKLLFLLFLSLAVIYILISYRIIVIDNQYLADNDVRYNLITINSIIGGFLFTGLSLVFGLTGKQRIRRLEEYGYFDEFYNIIFAGILSHLASIVVSLMMLFNILGKVKKIAYLEMTFLIVGLVFFVDSVFFLKRIINLLRK